MSKSKNNNKKKIAIALMSTLFCSGNGNKNNTLAMNAMGSKVQSPQTLGAVGGGGNLGNKNTKISNTAKGVLALLASVALVITGVIVVKNCSGKNNDEDKDKKVNEQEINKKNIKNDLEDTSEKDILENKNKNKKLVIGDEKSKLNSKEAKETNILKRISQCWTNWYDSSKYKHKQKFPYVVSDWRISNVMTKISEKVADYKNSGLLDKITNISNTYANIFYYDQSLSNGKRLYSDKLQQLADIFSGESEPSEIDVDFDFNEINGNKLWKFDFKHQGKESRLELQRKGKDRIVLEYIIGKIEIKMECEFKWLVDAE